jgi:hypothetical protein
MLALLGARTSTRPADDATAAAATAGADSTAKPATTQERALERYSSYAGPPVQSFTWLGHFDSWEHHLVQQRGVRGARLHRGEELSAGQLAMPHR